MKDYEHIQSHSINSKITMFTIKSTFTLFMYTLKSMNLSSHSSQSKALLLYFVVLYLFEPVKFTFAVFKIPSAPEYTAACTRKINFYYGKIYSHIRTNNLIVVAKSMYCYTVINIDLICLGHIRCDTTIRRQREKKPRLGRVHTGEVFQWISVQLLF